MWKFAVARKGRERSALLLLPVCRYEWSVWGQMSASSGRSDTQWRWVESQLLPLTSLSLSHLSHTLFTGDAREIVAKGFRWSPTTPQRPGYEFPAIISCSLPPATPRARLTILVCTFLSLCLSASLSSPSPRSSSYDNLFWLLTSCLSLIQYSGFSAIQPWPKTTVHLAFPWIS